MIIYNRDESGTVFIRTDQLDGETDWKLRKPINQTQKFLEEKSFDEFKDLLSINCRVKASCPIGEIYKFEGVFKNLNDRSTESLGLEQTLWANCVLASALIVGKALFNNLNVFFLFMKLFSFSIYLFILNIKYIIK